MSTTTTMVAEGMTRVPTYSPTPSTSQAVFYPHGEPTFHSHHSQSYPHSHSHPQRYMAHPNSQVQPQYMEYVEPPSGIHEVAQGRMAIPMQPNPNMVMMKRRATPSPNPSMMDCGPSPFLPMDDGMMTQSPSVLMHPNLPLDVSPTDEIRHHPDMQRGQPMQMMEMQAPHPQHQHHASQSQQQHRRPPSHQGRPPMMQRHSMQVPQQPTRPAPLQRHASLQAPMHRSASPHIVQGDVFDPIPSHVSPPKRPSSSLGLVAEREQVNNYPFGQEMLFFQTNHGISPARALGPAPTQPHQFSPPHRDNLMITPHASKTGYMQDVHSSGATSSTATSSSSLTSASEGGSSVERRPMLNSSDDENDDSPTKGPAGGRNKADPETTPIAVPRPLAMPMAARPTRPITRPTVIGGRTSAKFAKVAEDPGVEGVPPGPRSMERPAPSFACIIGQAILRCKAGGLSLEHIYRYVETAYPFFKSGDGAWRNSVRHNLSIHKMFETIPRTEKFPPGKGGIWIIHEEEKCHWPSEDKFTKNFPPSHPHHAVCRQTLHERQKEKEAMEKAAREGKVYVPKKGKKGRKLACKDDDEDGEDMVRSCSAISDMQPPRTLPPAPDFIQPIVTPQMQTKLLHHSMPPPILELDLEDDGDFLPLKPERETTPIHDLVDPSFYQDEPLVRPGIMVPPRFERIKEREKRRPIEDEENVFTSSVKRVRVAEPLPLHPIGPDPQSYLDDSFITPERERPGLNTNSSTAKLHSSAFKTPALVNTSSSPGSSPMPPTVPRTAHHPSALQQAWTQDDMADTASNMSSPRPMLDAAFDLKPKAPRARFQDEDFIAPSMIASNNNNNNGAPPKTPVSRSSAAQTHQAQSDKSQPQPAPTPNKQKSQSDGQNVQTPRLALRTPMYAKTPMMFPGSPARAPPTVSALLSTPAWEMSGCLDRLRDQDVLASPTNKLALAHAHAHGHGGIRTPMPPTSPTRYAMLLDSGGGSPRKRELI